MRTIGITGGVGAGKSEVLNYIETHYNCRVIRADLVAHQVRKPGTDCFQKLVALLGSDVLNADGDIDHGIMATKIFADSHLLQAVNDLIHPAVKEFILSEIEKERARGVLSFFFVEAALLIEEGYDKVLDELWYIFAREDVRKERLMASRHYSLEKIEGIFARQLSEDCFKKHCKVIIDNSEELTTALHEIDQILKSPAYSTAY